MGRTELEKEGAEDDSRTRPGALSERARNTNLASVASG